MAGESILVVDDEEDILLTLRAFLEGVMGAKVVTARSGAEALEKMAKAKEPFDLVISDYRMPAMDGLHFLRRAGEMRPEAPRVLLTAYPDTRLAIDAVNQARIVRFLTKPIDPDKLQGVVQMSGNSDCMTPPPN